MSASTGFEPLILDGLCGRPVSWAGLGDRIDEFVETCGEQGVAPLLYHRLKVTEALNDVPKPLRHRLMARVVAAEAVRFAVDAELISILESLASSGIVPLLFKGNALAHSCYPESHLRLGCDSDLLVSHRDLEGARRVLQQAGYVESDVVMGEMVMNQTVFSRSLSAGGRHVVDLHWELRNTPVLSGVLSYEELLGRAQSLPSLGTNARSPSLPDSCLIACMNRANDRATNRLIWLYDLHLLLEKLPDEEARRLVQLAREKQIRSICLDGFEAARRRFQTRMPGGLVEGLSKGRPFSEEASARLLTETSRAGRMVTDLKAVSGWRRKARLLRQHLFPPAAYMKKRYSTGSLLLPFFYLRRILRGIGKMGR